ncbi:unnamed protein product [Nesidiocoris tenuis]|uniref:Uncharacterized protein n=1 Tax=Nesidiocoris tenuis TaxID=355587 RepID=A0A6H5HKJ7_9HEMI|nr:unnamed protein product [Nesidiocoris tenuis]
MYLCNRTSNEFYDVRPKAKCLLAKSSSERLLIKDLNNVSLRAAPIFHFSRPSTVPQDDRVRQRLRCKRSRSVAADNRTCGLSAAWKQQLCLSASTIVADC